MAGNIQKGFFLGINTKIPLGTACIQVCLSCQAETGLIAFYSFMVKLKRKEMQTKQSSPKQLLFYSFGEHSPAQLKLLWEKLWQ